MWNDLEEFIQGLCEDYSAKNNRPAKVVEIGVGKFQSISNHLKEKDYIELTMVDIDPANENVVKDDVFKPNMKIYEDADIIFSIRPPAELQEAILKIRNQVGCTLIIKPLFNEDINSKTKKLRLKNYNRASFYILEE